MFWLFSSHFSLFLRERNSGNAAEQGRKMSAAEGIREQKLDGEDSTKSTESSQEEVWDGVVKNKYGGIKPKKPPLIAKDNERAYFDSADWALGKQGVEKPKGPIEALRPKLQPTQQHTQYRKSPCAPANGEDDEEGSPSEGPATQ